ncbi:hypothetical protein D3C71_1975990 [compost metagenome]
MEEFPSAFLFSGYLVNRIPQLILIQGQHISSNCRRLEKLPNNTYNPLGNVHLYNTDRG